MIALLRAVLKFQTVSAFIYFAIVIHFLKQILFPNLQIELYKEFSYDVLPLMMIFVCSILGTLCLLNYIFPMQLLAAIFWFLALLDLTSFSGFDESGLSTDEKITDSVTLFFYAGFYLFFLRRFKKNRNKSK